MRIIQAATGVILAGSTPVVRREKVNVEIASDPNALADKIARMSNDVAELSARVSQGDSVVFQDVEASGLGATMRLQHNLNKRVMWRAVDWTGAVAAPALVRDAQETTANVLVLRSYVAGTVSVEVF